MAQPIAVRNGTAFAFPNICLTPSPSGQVPVPYPSIADLGTAKDDSKNVTVGGLGVILSGLTNVPSTSGDEAGTDKGVTSGTVSGPCEFPQGSSTVEINGSPVVRIGDQTDQNIGNGNANAVGTVMSGDATVLVGG